MPFVNDTRREVLYFFCRFELDGAALIDRSANDVIKSDLEHVKRSIQKLEIDHSQCTLYSGDKQLKPDVNELESALLNSFIAEKITVQSSVDAAIWRALISVGRTIDVRCLQLDYDCGAEFLDQDNFMCFLDMFERVEKLDIRCDVGRSFMTDRLLSLLAEKGVPRVVFSADQHIPLDDDFFDVSDDGILKFFFDNTAPPDKHRYLSLGLVCLTPRFFMQFIEKYREARSTKVIFFAYLYLRPLGIDEFNFGDEPHKRAGERSITFTDLQLEFVYVPHSGLIALHEQLEHPDHLLDLLQSL